jgi:predicted dehydrogenase
LSNEKRLVIGQIGCGYWGPNLLRVLNSSSDSTVKWVVDSSPERREFVVERYPDTLVTASVSDSLDDPEVDAIVVSTPAGTHAELVEQALDAGKHVFVEKPLATTAEDATRLVDKASRLGLVLMAGHTFLYNDAVRKLKSLVHTGELGDIYYMSSRRVNLGQVRSDVNAWWNLAPHDVSIFLFLRDGEMPVSIQASGSDFIQSGIEDVVFATLTWADGVVGHIHVSWLDPLKAREVVLVGSKKMVVYDDIDDRKIGVYDKRVERIPRIGEEMHFDGGVDYRIFHTSGDVNYPRFDFQEPLANEMEHFLSCVKSGDASITGGQHAIDVTRILVAGNESLKSGQTVSL